MIDIVNSSLQELETELDICDALWRLYSCDCFGFYITALQRAITSYQIPMNTPNLEEIKEHFAKAKEINCLSLNIRVDVSLVSNFTYSEEDNSWKGIGGIICFWKENKFAEITKKKCGKDCAGCKPCSEKRKQIKK